MKVLFPQNIQKGLFSGFSISILGFTISMLQMFVMAIGIVIALGVFSQFSKAEARGLGMVFAILIVLFFAVITFFKVSELILPAFIAKKIKDFFLDTTQKYQVNHKKDSPVDLAIAKAKAKESKKKIEIKSGISSINIDALDKGGLI